MAVRNKKENIATACVRVNSPAATAAVSPSKEENSCTYGTPSSSAAEIGIGQSGIMQADCKPASDHTNSSSKRVNNQLLKVYSSPAAILLQYLFVIFIVHSLPANLSFLTLLVMTWSAFMLKATIWIASLSSGQMHLLKGR